MITEPTRKLCIEYGEISAIINSIKNGYEAVMITPDQCRAARALLNWTQAHLADRAGVDTKSIANFERLANVRLQARTTAAVEHALAEAGVELIAEDRERGAGVRLRSPGPGSVQLVRRDPIKHRDWIAFVWARRGERRTGFVRYEALGLSNPEADPAHAFDERRDTILAVAAAKFDDGDFDPEGRLIIGRDELEAA